MVCFFPPQKVYFPTILEVLNFVPPKGLSLKSFFSPYSVFFFGFPFCLPFQNSIFLCFLSINPHFENIISFGFILFFLPFPFLMFACFFGRNFPNIPFFKPRLLSFLAVFFFFLVFLLFSWCLFRLSVSMLVLLLVIFLLCLLSCFLFCFHSMKKKHCFSLQFWCFLKLSWLKGCLIFYV